MPTGCMSLSNPEQYYSSNETGFMNRVISILLCASLGAIAADDGGIWNLVYTTTNGLRRASKLDVKVEGDSLTGTLSSDRGTARVEHGTIRGDEIAFDLIRISNNDQIIVHFRGRIEGDTMRLTMQYGTRDPVAIVGTKGI